MKRRLREKRNSWKTNWYQESLIWKTVRKRSLMKWRIVGNPRLPFWKKLKVRSRMKKRNLHKV